MGIQGSHASDVFDQFKNVSESDYNTLVKSFSNKASKEEAKSAVDALSKKVLFRPTTDGAVAADSMYTKIGKFFRNLFSSKSRSEATEYSKARDNMQIKIEQETESIGNAILKTGQLERKDAERIQKAQYAVQVMNAVTKKINRRNATYFKSLTSLEDPVEIACSVLEKKIKTYKENYKYKKMAEQKSERMSLILNALRDSKKLKISDKSTLDPETMKIEEKLRILKKIADEIPELPNPKAVSTHHILWRSPRKK
jgi:hypothetical protein